MFSWSLQNACALPTTGRLLRVHPDAQLVDDFLDEECQVTRYVERPRRTDSAPL
jgi:hypothetical protein